VAYRKPLWQISNGLQSASGARWLASVDPYVRYRGQGKRPPAGFLGPGRGIVVAVGSVSL